MKQKLLILVIIIAAFSQYSFRQDSTQNQSSQLINSYYQLKDNLVESNANRAAATAVDLANAIKTADKQKINEVTKAGLLADANAIAQSKDLIQQGESFKRLSKNMFELAKSVKLSANPVYQQYCPMKKASWLSSEKEIKNPYYGSAMIACGSVKSIL